MRKAILTGFGALACLTACAATPGSLIREGAGSTSQSICSKVFVSGLDASDVFRDHLRPEPGMGLIAWAMRYSVDRDLRQVTTRVGGIERRSVFAEGRGCTLAYPGVAAPTPITNAAHAPALLPPIAGPDVVATGDPRLVAALDAAFAEPAQGPRRVTQAVVIVKDGRIIAERYAPGIGPDTPLLSHSMSKSMISTLAGVLVRDGKLRLDETLGAPEWPAGDPRAMTTVEQHLRMISGMGFDEGQGSSIATNIWYNEPDMAAAAAQGVLLKAQPGARWGYSSRSYLLLSRLVQERVGGSPQAFHDFTQREILDPLAMTTFVAEFDSRGTPMGAHAMLASARDWARFGMLYLDGGIVGDKRILPEDWVRRVTTPSAGGGYGAGFWLNTTDAEIPEWKMHWGMPGAPKDAFFARGYMGQYTVIVPSARLVIVRMGESHRPGMDIDSVGRLVASVIAATGASPGH